MCRSEMTYIRIDDRFPTHRKALAAGPYGRDLYVGGLAYCSLHLTDGIIALSALDACSAAPVGYAGRGNSAWAKVLRREAECLVTIGLWERVDGIGYRVHDFHDWNKSASEIMKIKNAKAEAGRAGGRRSGEARRKHPASMDEAEIKQSGSLLPNPSTATSIPLIPPASASKRPGQKDEDRRCTDGKEGQPLYRNRHPLHQHFADCRFP